MSEPKRKNFSKDEKEKIISPAVKCKEIIENKKTDSNSHGEKAKCWKAITDEFNSNTSTPRTTVQLKTFYKNAKSDIKKKIAANRASIFRTGGGEHQSLLEENDPLISVVTAQTFSVENRFDSSYELFEIERVEEAAGEAISETVSENDVSLQQAESSRRRKRQRSKQPTPFEEERQNMFKEIIELKRQKLEVDIENKKLKNEVYKAKLDILNNCKNNNNNKED